MANPIDLSGPRLKTARSLNHVKELDRAIQTFLKENAYTITNEPSADGTQHIWRVRVHKTLPIEWSAMIGDVVHNLRSALDQLVCQLIRAYRSGQPKSRSGFPIATSEKRFNEAVVGKIGGVSPQAERFIRRLKPYKGGNDLLWILHELDAMDKHVEIVPIGAATSAAILSVPSPIGFIPEQGVLRIGGGVPPVELMPDDFKPVFPLKDNVELYRTKAGFPHQMRFKFEVTLDRTRVLNGGEPILELLIRMGKFVERTIDIVERRIL